jgi:hypothetical protein
MLLYPPENIFRYLKIVLDVSCLWRYFVIRNYTEGVEVMKGLIRVRMLREYALGVAASTRYHKFTRVSAMFQVEAEAALRKWVAGYISKLPSKGKTII